MHVLLVPHKCMYYWCLMNACNIAASWMQVLLVPESMHAWFVPVEIHLPNSRFPEDKWSDSQRIACPVFRRMYRIPEDKWSDSQRIKSFPEDRISRFPENKVSLLTENRISRLPCIISNDAFNACERVMLFACNQSINQSIHHFTISENYYQ